MERKFELRIDHHRLKYVFEQPNLNARQIIWMKLPLKNDFEIKHRKGKENKVEDELSRKMHVMHVAINNSTSYLNDGIK